jgi:2-polyprenyl-3-methyl-5-hydroxy-6-metoxy-1,4-benzoquinol methylase
VTLDPSRLAEVDEAQRVRYDARLEEHGRDPRTLGWGNAAQMAARFATVAGAVEPAGKDVLDVGCGFGDLLGYLNESGRAPASYQGWDINPRPRTWSS